MQEIKMSEWAPRKNVIIFGDEDVDGVCSTAIVGKKYSPNNSEFIFVNARNLGTKLRKKVNELDLPDIASILDVFILDVGINKANIKSIEASCSDLVEQGVRVYYFDSHSNKYQGKPLIKYLTRANVKVHHGKIGSATASIVQDFLGDKSTERLQQLGALSDREYNITSKFRHEKTGLRAFQASVAWGAWKNIEFLQSITRKLIENPNLTFEHDKTIVELSTKANNHRDHLLKHIFAKAQVLQISETPRILATIVLDRVDFGKARGTIAGRLAGEWGAAIILITPAIKDYNSYAVTVRNSYIHKLDLESMGQLSLTKNSGGSKGAYRLTIKKDYILTFLARVQEWSKTINPPWLEKANGYKYQKPIKRKINGQKTYTQKPKVKGKLQMNFSEDPNKSKNMSLQEAVEAELNND
ncbi:MAG: hypothetical protein OEZ01_12110 [Candidatus Heimdallarchaeota archaeon]|nr:hypothetical protein [Candidatus Heimdallarchaeota archaeon]MDH5646749.1 hypothetical protein [Candidatus Heimdallarchaeota archaeon]